MHADPELPPPSPSPPSPRPRRLPDFAFVAVAVAHFLLNIAVGVSAYSLSMRGFDGNEPPHPAAPVLWQISDVMSFPLVLPFRLMGTPVRGPAVWVLLLANSACWGYAVSWAVDRLRRRR